LVLFQLGPITIDVFPYNVDSVEREAAADWAHKHQVGRLPGAEFVGEGEDRLTLRGQILPTKIGGLGDLAAMHGLRAAGTPVIAVRGDGAVMGWYAIDHVREAHDLLAPNGVGQVVKYEVRLFRVDPRDGAAGSLLDMLMSLF
jgi:uncharacterized protein